MSALDVFDVLDQAESDPAVLQARQDYLDDKIEVGELDTIIGRAQAARWFGEEWTRLVGVVEDARVVHARELATQHEREEIEARIEWDIQRQQQAPKPAPAVDDAELYQRLKAATLAARAPTQDATPNAAA
jgi:hypothetical protein